MSATIELARQLIARPSVTPQDQGCQQMLAERLQGLGFTIENLPFAEVSNLWATRGKAGPTFCFAGHTDVVPAGPLTDWHSDPFVPTERDGFLHGRGSADMKGSLAAMITATERFVAAATEVHGRIGFLLTSDEEGQAVNGTRRVVELLRQRGERIEYCVVGEPSCSEQLGDTLRIGRRGSLSARLTVNGIGGHIAYWQRADNPIHKALPALQQLTTEQWDQGNTRFPATSLQISNIHAGVGANNVIPATVVVDFNLRYSTELTAARLQQRVEAILAAAGLVDFDCDWHVSGEPYLTEATELSDAMQTAIGAVTGRQAELSTGGGTSDGRFIARLGTQIVEFGPCNGSIHQPNERVALAELEQLSAVYEQVLHTLLGQQHPACRHHIAMPSSSAPSNSRYTTNGSKPMRSTRRRKK